MSGNAWRRCVQHLAGEEVFMASYGDNLTDLEIPRLIKHFEEQDRTVCFTSVRPSHSFHIAGVDDDALVTSLTPAQESDLSINGGFFIFKQSVFDHKDKVPWKVWLNGENRHAS